MRLLLITLSLLLLSLHTGFAQESEPQQADTEPTTTETVETTETSDTAETAETENLVSPIGAMVRSAFIPGWGQYYGRGYFRGSFTVLGISTAIVGGLLAQRSFQNRYNTYATYASLYPNDEPGIFERYEYANQRYKLRTFFMYAGIGIWVYSLIDSYVGANFYNATTLIQSIEEDAQHIENLGLEVGATPSRLYLGIVKTF